MNPKPMTNDSDRVAPDRRIHLPSPTPVRPRRRIAAGVLSLLLALSCFAASPAWAYKAGYGADDTLSSIKEYNTVAKYVEDTTRNSYLYVKIKHSGRQYTLKQSEVEAFHKANTPLTDDKLIKQYPNLLAYTNDNTPQPATRLYADIGKNVYRVTELEEARRNTPSGGSIDLDLLEPVDSFVEDIDIFETTAVGHDAEATGYKATAIGTNTEATDINATAIGSGASAEGYGATAIGSHASATGNRSIAIGVGAGTTAASQGAIAIGMQSRADGWKPIAIGAHAQAYGNIAIAMGRSVQAHGDGAIALGPYAAARGGGAVSLGIDADALVGGAMALGPHSRATRLSIAVGGDSHATGERSTAVGESSEAHGNDTVAVGRRAVAGRFPSDKTYKDMAAYRADTTRTSSIIHVQVGNKVYKVTTLDAFSGLTENNRPAALTTTEGGVAMGVNTRATGTNSIALGRNARATGTRGIAIGSDVSAGQNEVVIGGAKGQHTYKLPGLVKTTHTSGTRVVTVDSEGRLSTQAATSSPDTDNSPDTEKVPKPSRSASLRGAAVLSSEVTPLNRDLGTRTDAADYEKAPAIGSGPDAPETAEQRRVVVQDTNRDGSVRLRTLDFGDLTGVDRRLAGVEQRMTSLSDRLNKATAMSAALSALPNVVPGDNRFFLGVGAGHYSSEQALAIGMSARVGRHVFVNAGAALASGDDASVRGGVGVVW